MGFLLILHCFIFTLLWNRLVDGYLRLRLTPSNLEGDTAKTQGVAHHPLNRAALRSTKYEVRSTKCGLEFLRLILNFLSIFTLLTIDNNPKKKKMSEGIFMLNFFTPNFFFGALIFFLYSKIWSDTLAYQILEGVPLKKNKGLEKKKNTVGEF